jgi:hypothetical protein
LCVALRVLNCCGVAAPSAVDAERAPPELDASSPAPLLPPSPAAVFQQYSPVCSCEGRSSTGTSATTLSAPRQQLVPAKPRPTLMPAAVLLQSNSNHDSGPYSHMEIENQEREGMRIEPLCGGSRHEIPPSPSSRRRTHPCCPPLPPPFPGCLPLHACDLATASTSSRLPAAASNLSPLVRPRKAAQSSAAVLAPV